MSAPLYYQRLIADKPFERNTAEAILEIAFLTMCADKHIDDDEVVAFRSIASELLGGEAGDAKAWIEALAERTAGADAESLVDELADNLSMEARKAAYQVACRMALADNEESDREFEFDLTLISSLDLAQSDADELAAEARRFAGAD